MRVAAFLASPVFRVGFVKNALLIRSKMYLALRPVRCALRTPPPQARKGLWLLKTACVLQDTLFTVRGAWRVLPISTSPKLRRTVAKVALPIHTLLREALKCHSVTALPACRSKIVGVPVTCMASVMLATHATTIRQRAAWPALLRSACAWLDSNLPVAPI